MESIEATEVIQRPIEEVFEFYRDFTNLPRFLGDVMAVEQIDTATSHWTIQGPLGVHVSWTVRVTEERANELICYETVGPSALKTRWEVYFSRTANAGETRVRETMHTPFGGGGRAALALIGKPPSDEVSANLHRLKELLETGRVTDTSHAVDGKFDRR